MAQIKPVRALRYNASLTDQIENLTSPLFDVVSDKQREVLYQHPYNSIHLSVPQGENAAGKARQNLAAWKANSVLMQDVLPGIYGYYQYFSLPGNARQYCRKGFICHIKAYDWSENVILRHENTIPASVNDRIELLEKTLLHASPTHGLYRDEAFTLEGYLDESMRHPLYETEDYQGVRDVLSVIHDHAVIRKFISTLKDQPVILADGHHRYESSLIYRKRQMAANPGHTGEEPYNFHLMYLTNAASDDIVILPTHRLVSGLPNWNAPDFLQKLEPYFTIRPLENPYDAPEIIAGKPWAFGLLLGDGAYKIRLKPEVLEHMTWHFPEVVKRLDLTVLHYFVIERALGIPGRDQRKSPYISFSRNFTQCVTAVREGMAQVALITNAVCMEEIQAVCRSGYTLPQKSTYFYPKVIAGFLFSSIQPDEFSLPHCKEL
jgi:uncharacterized protein (DUF1015 family)